MFYELSKFLRVLVISPASWIIVLLVAGYLFRKKKAVKISCWSTSLLIFLLFGNPALYEIAAGACMKKYGKAELRKPHYEMAIVLGGFGDMNQETGQFRGNQNSARIWDAVRLYKTGKVDRILITGDATSDIKRNGKSDARLFLDYMNGFGVADSVFVLEQKARNTRENAVLTTGLLKEMNIPADSCLLITSASHMKRSLGCFSKCGLEPDWYSTGISRTGNCDFTFRSLYPTWETIIKWEGLISEWIGNITYRAMGYTQKQIQKP